MLLKFEARSPCGDDKVAVEYQILMYLHLHVEYIEEHKMLLH
jgi:hypothetical protein